MPTERRRIAITGATRGLGRSLAFAFAAAGHEVAGCGRSSGAIGGLTDAFGPPHRFEVVDVADDREVSAWAESVLMSGPPDVLINNAAVVNAPAPLWDVPAGEFDRLIDVNIKGVANGIRHLVPAMIGRGSGVIVNLSSGWGRSVSPGVAPYCGSKWAIEGLTRALALDLPPGLAAVPLNPGIIDTDMLRVAFGDRSASFPDPETWARTAAPFILGLGPGDNGRPLTVPGR